MRQVLACGALAAFALVIVSSVPHLHHEIEGEEDRCVLCLAQDAPSLATGLHANPDPVVRSAVLPVAVPGAVERTPSGGGSRAPPA